MLVSSRHSTRRTRCTPPSPARSPPSASRNGTSRPPGSAWPASSGPQGPPAPATAGCGPAGSASACGAHGRPPPDRPARALSEQPRFCDDWRRGPAGFQPCARRPRRRGRPALGGLRTCAGRLACHGGGGGRSRRGQDPAGDRADRPGARAGGARAHRGLPERGRGGGRLCAAGRGAAVARRCRGPGRAGASARQLARLVPELGAPAGTGGQAAPGAGALTPGRLFELLLGVLHRLAERGPLLLVVEDLHWADQSTRDLLGFLVRNLRTGVMLLLTYRSDELHRRHPLRPFLTELDRSGRAERLELGRLGRRELGELLAGILGEPAPAAVAGEIMARSEGNPFFAEELLAARAEGVGGSAELPEALRDLLLARVEALPQATERLLQVAAVAGQRVDHH